MPPSHHAREVASWMVLRAPAGFTLNPGYLV